MHPLHRADALVGDTVRRLTGQRPRTHVLIGRTTDLGSLFMVVPAALALARLGRGREAAEVTAAGGLAWVVGQRAKLAFNRRRPYQNEGLARLIPEPHGSSMPSGHAAVAAAVATVLAGRSLPTRRWPWVAMAAYVGVTRVHLGVHYPGDAVVGASLGYGLGLAVRATSTRIAGGRPTASAERGQLLGVADDPDRGDPSVADLHDHDRVGGGAIADPDAGLGVHLDELD